MTETTRIILRPGRDVLAAFLHRAALELKPGD